MSVLKRYSWMILILTGIGFLYFLNSSSDGASQMTKVKEVTIEETVDENAGSGTVKVDVKGEVHHPGVYSMPEETRVDDVIIEAGGMTDGADPTSVNLAQKLQDEMVVFIASYQSSANESGEVDSLAGEKVSINRASASEMETLNGIGPSKAASIIKYREENGPFSSVEDLVNVPGIGEKTLENLKELITVP
ncbi:helix-hairpin-helix domain-containing protein [Halobacillus sp. Nhm2S1]|uniref:helix-hairpin-helix domain-containing protein n=1 Tax=Halobacillus sp. Nhm2S1 TaxID=2866716 RepID=UPI001C72DA82|nr:helix-hairpin-helix domain-containing protein [Halobacillus sp. Nhm2S1]MBX0358785.1 helix-hairpin-helix domain-containing protein [Halobacillus sp. Nhm2S1]